MVPDGPLHKSTSEAQEADKHKVKSGKKTNYNIKPCRSLHSADSRSTRSALRPARGCSSSKARHHEPSQTLRRW